MQSGGSVRRQNTIPDPQPLILRRKSMKKQATEVKKERPAGMGAKGPVSAKPGVVVVMRADNAARPLEKSRGHLPKDIVGRVILVDAASQDETADIARRL